MCIMEKNYVVQKYKRVLEKKVVRLLFIILSEYSPSTENDPL